MILYTCLLYLDSSKWYLSPWICHNRSIFNNCGMSGIWLDQQFHNPDWLKKAIERRLKDQRITTWCSNILTKGICKSNKMYKAMYVQEYDLLRLRKNIRILLTKITSNDNRLSVVTGRYENVRREERLCTKCRNNVVRDEFPIMLLCSNENNVELRKRFIPNYYGNNTTLNKFIALTQSRNIQILTNISYFLSIISKMLRKFN